jgi:hypothetical protein
LDILFSYDLACPTGFSGLSNSLQESLAQGFGKRRHLLFKIRGIQACGLFDYFYAKDAQLAHPGGRQPHDKAQRIVILCTRKSSEQLISNSRNCPDMRCLSPCHESEYQVAPLDSLPHGSKNRGFRRFLRHLRRNIGFQFPVNN